MKTNQTTIEIIDELHRQNPKMSPRQFSEFAKEGAPKNYRNLKGKVYKRWENAVDLYTTDLRRVENYIHLKSRNEK